MNFRKPPRLEPGPIDMKALANSIEGKREEPIDFAPPALRQQHQVEAFTEVPAKEVERVTRELEEVLRAAKEEVTVLERNATTVKALYIKHSIQITEDIKRLREGVRLAEETMKTLRTQCQDLNDRQESKE